MAKKFGKFLLFTAAAGTAAAAAYYLTRKKDTDMESFQNEDDDYDDFSDASDGNTDSSRSYVALTREGAASSDDADTTEKDSKGFTPLTEQLSQDAENTSEETVEEFFDEEDSFDEEPPILD